MAGRRYIGIADSISEAIAERQYLPGARLPSERDLAEAFSVGRQTIRGAIIALEVRGLIEARWRSGLFVKPGAQRLAEQKRR